MRKLILLALCMLASPALMSFDKPTEISVGDSSLITLSLLANPVMFSYPYINGGPVSKEDCLQALININMVQSDGKWTTVTPLIDYMPGDNVLALLVLADSIEDAKGLANPFIEELSRITGTKFGNPTILGAV